MLPRLTARLFPLSVSTSDILDRAEGCIIYPYACSNNNVCLICTASLLPKFRDSSEESFDMMEEAQEDAADLHINPPITAEARLFQAKIWRLRLM
jgi:hypothetical protein